MVLIARLAKRRRVRADGGRVFVTRYWKPWNADAVAEQFRKLCKNVGVPCYGFYRLRHCASTAMSLVATPHVHRKFMRHSQLQQQVTYTHTPDEEVDMAVMRARERLLPGLSEDEGSGLRPAGVFEARQPGLGGRGLVLILQQPFECRGRDPIERAFLADTQVDRGLSPGSDQGTDVFS